MAENWLDRVANGGPEIGFVLLAIALRALIAVVRWWKLESNARAAQGEKVAAILELHARATEERNRLTEALARSIADMTETNKRLIVSVDKIESTHIAGQREGAVQLERAARVVDDLEGVARDVRDALQKRGARA